MDLVVSIITGSVIANFLVALSNTVIKERQMIKEGGGPLPSSAYVFLTLRFVLWGLVAIGLSNLAVFQGLSMEASSWAILITVGLIVGAYIIVLPIEVLVRTIVFISIQKARIKKLEKELKDKGKEE